MQKDYADLKKKLEEEKTLLERELKSVGRTNPDDQRNWETTSEDLNIQLADVNERADEITDYEDRSAIEFELEERYNEIKHALERMENGNYGICDVCKNPIEDDRLHANPSAQTCKKHMG